VALSNGFGALCAPNVGKTADRNSSPNPGTGERRGREGEEEGEILSSVNNDNNSLGVRFRTTCELFERVCLPT